MPIFPTLYYSETSLFLLLKTHLHLIVYFSYKISLLRKQHNQCYNTKKTTLAAALTTFNLHIIYLTLSYIFQTHFPQNTHTYFSYISKFHVSQSIYIYIRFMSNKVSTYNCYTYYKHHISQYIHSSYNFHTS